MLNISKFLKRNYIHLICLVRFVKLLNQGSPQIALLARRCKSKRNIIRIDRTECLNRLCLVNSVNGGLYCINGTSPEMLDFIDVKEFFVRFFDCTNERGARPLNEKGKRIARTRRCEGGGEPVCHLPERVASPQSRIGRN